MLRASASARSRSGPSPATTSDTPSTEADRSQSYLQRLLWDEPAREDERPSVEAVTAAQLVPVAERRHAERMREDLRTAGLDPPGDDEVAQPR